MEQIQTLSIDIETFSDVDLVKCGVYKYSESENFEILLMAISVNGSEAVVIDLAQGETVPIDFIRAFVDSRVIKWAFNANFERICLSSWIRKNYPEIFEIYGHSGDTVDHYLDPSSWRCSMIWSAYLGLPLSLAGVGAVLGLSKQKMKEGRELIRYFCTPCKATKANGMRRRNLPSHAPENWEQFKAYNKRDVQVEMAIQERLKHYPVPDFLWEEYIHDQEINDRGIRVDMDVAENGIAFDGRSREELMATLQELTELENPNSVAQMKRWLSENDFEMESLGKKEVKKAIPEAPDEIAEVLLLRQQLAKSSVRKYQAMQNAVCRDGRARGMFQFYGANRTGRFAGRIIQLQNLPQNHIPDLAQARALVKQGNYEAMELLYEDIPATLSQLIRTAFVPREGKKFVVADFSAIEARVLAFLAQEKWRTEVFAKNGDIYCASASEMFGIPVEKNGINGHMRQKGKIAELALGYGGSVGALTSMGALEMGLEEAELKPLVDSWRTANPNIVRFWWEVDRAVKLAVRNKKTSEVRGIRFSVKSGMLFIHLPSGRDLCYVKPKMGENQFGGESVTYEGVGTNKKWERIESYGPKFVENIVQAISRDILVHAMCRLAEYSICGHVHDELIIECDKNTSVSEICDQMGHSPPWLPGILLRADGYECDFYQKD